jgi:hypothetical protein
MTRKEYPKTPELDKLNSVKDQSHTIGEFLEWLWERKNYELCCYKGDRYYQIPEDMEELLSEYFNINLKEVLTEKCLLLDYVQNVNLWPDSIMVK